MIKFVRSFFGLNKSSSNRTVAGTSVSYDLQEVAYIKDSNDRLAALQNLQKRYKGTVHEEKIKSVYEKTKKIHTYLVSRKRIHELELFHIRNTEHFINTFTLIIDVYQSGLQQKEEQQQKEQLQPNGKETARPVLIQEQEDQIPLSKAESKSPPQKGELYEIVERVRNKNKTGSTVFLEDVGAEVPTLAIPEISINSIAKVLYLKEDSSGNKITHEISFISSQQEKEAFQGFVSSRLGIKDIYYVGNARINLPRSKDSLPEEMVPVFYWGNFLYALSLDDYRIFPVKIIRKSM